VLSINGRQPDPTEAGGVLHGGEIGGPPSTKSPAAAS